MLCCVVANTDSIVSDCVSTLDEKSDMSAEIAASFCSLSLRAEGEDDICQNETEGKRQSKNKWKLEVESTGAGREQDSSERTESIAIRSQTCAASADFLDCCRKSQTRNIVTSD